MAKQSPTFKDFNPTGDDRVTAIKGRVDEVIELVRHFTQASGPQTQRRASLAITNLEQGAMWGVKALFSEDAIKGLDRALAKELSDARDGEPPDFDPKTGRDTAP